MADPLDRLKAAVADRYAVQRELGSGGMATVDLAEDLRYHRTHGHPGPAYILAVPTNPQGGEP